MSMLKTGLYFAGLQCIYCIKLDQGKITHNCYGNLTSLRYCKLGGICLHYCQISSRNMTSGKMNRVSSLSHLLKLMYNFSLRELWLILSTNNTVSPSPISLLQSLSTKSYLAIKDAYIKFPKKMSCYIII